MARATVMIAALLTLAACGQSEQPAESPCEPDGRCPAGLVCATGGFCRALAVTRVTAGGYHTCALLNTGAVRCWGFGYHGQLGYGNLDHVGDDELPADVGEVDVGGVVTQLDLGSEHTCALLDSGAVHCWGEAWDGQLGYGNQEVIGDNELPASVGPMSGDWSAVQIDVGADHSCALLDGGTVRCWGAGGYGKLGYGNTDTIGDDESPMTTGAIDVGGKVVQVSAGTRHTCALLEDSAVRCWGQGYEGVLGYGNTDNIGDDEAPRTAGDVELGGKVLQLSAGDIHTCALLDGGLVRCWGNGRNGSLGYGNIEHVGDDELPTDVGFVDIGGRATAIATGGSHTCALMEGGAVRCWGNANGGKLGYGNTEDIGDDETPAVAGDVDVGGTVIQISAARSHTCALMESGAVRCWGYGDLGQLGYGATEHLGDDETPASAGDVAVY